MILKSIHLENIRSYVDETVDFPMGAILFEGDIRSGKSTILYATEFALFGLGSLRGTFLLRNGEKEGSVTLVFEVNGSDYTVHRGLKIKGKSVQQSEEGYIKGPNGMAYLSAGEMKERVLQILNFNEPVDPKAQSLIYRYAIFTPQDEMKEIITKDVDRRLQTLRKAFTVEDYKLASLNAGSLSSVLKEKIAKLQGQTLDLDQKKRQLAEVIGKINIATKALSPLNIEEEKLQGEYDEQQKQLMEIQQAREEIKKIEAEIPLLRRSIVDKSKLLNENTNEMKKISRKINEDIGPRINELKKMPQPTTKTKEELKDDITKLRDETKKHERLKAKIDERKDNFETIIDRKKCPVCEQSIDSKEFKEKLAHIQQERENLEKKIDKLEKEAEKLEGFVDKIIEYNDAQRELKQLEPQLMEFEGKVERLNTSVTDLEKEIEELEGKLEEAEDKEKDLKKVSETITKVEEKIGEIERDLRRVRDKIVETRRDIENLQGSKADLEKEVGKKEEQLKFKENLDEDKIWLTNYFVPTVENIEKHVMVSINQRFNQQFERWFNVLIEDPELRVRVDEEFTPIITQNGYEQDYSSLSGGEKTSVALAYRLALNTIVQEVSTGMKSNLIILDEPTDGFSKEQLFKVRDILAELRCPQVIIVSHEKELESFADQVFKVQRSQGVSSVNRVK